MTTKFRAWLVDEKRMLHEGEIHSILLDGGKPFMLHVGYFDNGKSIDTYVNIGCRCVLMQAVWKDINEKEVFEGDILESDNENFATGVVVYDNGRFAIKKPNGKIIAYDFTIFTAYKVVGNIYENPELLEEKKLLKIK